MQGSLVIIKYLIEFLVWNKLLLLSEFCDHNQNQTVLFQYLHPFQTTSQTQQKLYLNLVCHTTLTWRQNDFSVAFCIAVCETQPSSPCRGLKDKIFFIYFLNVGKWEGGARIPKIISWFNGGAQARCIRKTSYYIIIRL